MKACLEHMTNKFSKPKNLETFWQKDKEAQSNLVFPIAIVREKAEDGEDPKKTAVRGVGGDGYSRRPRRAQVLENGERLARIRDRSLPPSAGLLVRAPSREVHAHRLGVMSPFWCSDF